MITQLGVHYSKLLFESVIFWFCRLARNPELLAEEIFRFLTILTHEYNSSKKFIDVSKIISLCHGLVSGAGNSNLLGTSNAVIFEQLILIIELNRFKCIQQIIV